MNKFRVKSSKLTANPGEGGWAQVHEFKPEDKEKLALRGHLFAVVATSKQEEGVDSVVLGREVLARLHEEYFGKTKLKAFNALKNAIEKVINEFTESLGQVEIAAAVLLQDVVYSAAGGGSQAAVFREGMLAKILISKKGEVVSASGYPQEDDIFLLGTASLFESLGEGIIKAALTSGKPQEIVESLAPAVHSKKEGGNLGLVVIKFEKPEVFEIGRPEKESKEKSSVKDLKISPPPLLQKVMNRLSAIKIKFPKKRIYVRREEVEVEVVQKRKVAVSIGAILVILLIVSIGFGIRQKKIGETRSRYEGRLTEAQHEFEEAIRLFSLNPERARELFIHSRNLSEELLGEGVSDRDLDELKKNLEQNRGYILGEYKIEPELFIDISLLSEGLIGDDLAASAGQLFVLDKNGKRIVQVSIDTKKTEVVAGPEQIDEVDDIAAYAERVFILNSSGVFEVGEEKKKAVDADWEGEVLAYTYAGNLYILEKGNSEIWRYPGTGETFSSRQRWLAPGVEPDLGNIFSWTIDGSIWFLSETGGIFKYTRGNQDSLTIASVVPNLSSPSAIYTNEELEFVYILEKENQRVVVIDKEGNYQAQYLNEVIGEAKNLAVSEEEGKIIFLTETKLYSIEAKHLTE
ncbi:hypothetical protein E3I18_01300 [Candidatus Woesebacteria bacterium]|nr:MAG: hypothetical protein E3I18_01300 [Candidatus Woesebacteria bacterium]